MHRLAYAFFVAFVFLAPLTSLVAGCGSASPLLTPDAAGPAADSAVDTGVPLRAVAIASSEGVACAIGAEGRVRCWGRWTGFVYSRTESIGPRPILIEGVERAVRIAVAPGHACAVRDDGAVLCWGFDNHGETGAPRTSLEAYDFHARPVVVPGITDAVDVAVGWMHSCALRRGGTVACWGDGALASLGDAEMTEWSASPVTVAGLTGVVHLEAGGPYSCAIDEGRALWCWGECAYGACGPEGRAQTPRRIAVDRPVRDVAMGAHRIVILGDDGAVRSIGMRMPLGFDESGTYAHTDVPEVVGAAPGAIAIDGARGLTCVVTEAGEARCMGENGTGELGRGTASEQWDSTFGAVSGLTDVVDVSAGDPACALTRAGVLSCWGGNAGGQLGTGIVGAKRPDEALVAVDGALAVQSGRRFACALRGDGRVACWGAADRGQLGDGGEMTSAVPQAVVDVDRVVALGVGAAHACAVRDDGDVVCWGGDDEGQLGRGTAGDPARIAIGVPGVSGALSIAAGDDRTCVIDADRRVVCWGANTMGQTAGAPLAPVLGPTVIAGLGPARALALGGNHTCVLEEGGTVACWGQDPRGAIGFVLDPDDPSHLTGEPGLRWLQGTPGRVPGLEGVTAIAASGRALCTAGPSGVSCRTSGAEMLTLGRVAEGIALGNDGSVTVLCGWGGGTASCVSERGAMELGPLAVARSIAVGFPICALGVDGAVRCTGSNERGELGDGQGFYALPQHVRE